MAIICWSSQDAVDILIPVLLKLKEILDESVMSGVLIRIKRRKRKGKYEINQRALNFFPFGTDGKRPFVAELGIQPPIHPAATTKAKVIGKILVSAPNPLPKPPAAKSPPIPHTSRCSISACGH